MLNFRQATVEDSQLVLDYIKKLAKYEQLEDEVTGTIDDVIANVFERDIAKVLIISDDSGNNVGFSLYFHNFSTFQVKPGLYIEDLYIDEEYRGLGYGTEVFNYYKKLAKEQGCGRIEWICLDWNQSAIEFYENKIGATPMTGWTIRRLIID